MTTATTKDVAALPSQQPDSGARLRRLLYLVLVSLLAGVFEVFLILTLKRVPLGSRFPMAADLLSFFHLLPLLAGLSCWANVRRAEVNGRINQLAAHLCYGVIAAILSATYVVLACMELAFVLPWVSNP